MATDPLTSSQNWDLICLTFGSLIACAIFTAWRANRTLSKQDNKDAGIKLSSRMGQGQWDFSQSFATNIAIIGSLLTLVLTSNALPAATKILPNDAYGGLAVFFGATVIVAPLLYNGTASRVAVSPGEVDTAAEYHGTVWGFLLAALLTEWGLLGSVATVFVTLLELYENDSMSVAPLILLAITLLVSMAFFARYSWIRIDGTILDQLDPVYKKARAELTADARAVNNLAAPTPDKPAPSPRWALL